MNAPEPNSTTPKFTYKCYICEEASTAICVYCTKDCCELHRCERCLRCTDCCICHQDQQPRQ
jgi:hypothetical protein